jgi:hypothetical protein
MSYIGIGSPIPDIASLPGQTGGEVEVTLDYPSAAVCSNGSDQTPSVKSPNGGTFSSTPSGLSINGSSGVVDVSESTPNNYTISYTVEGVVSSFAFTINQLEQSTFSYSASSFQQIGTATPTLASGTTAGGSFSASTGVSINTSTGVIDLAASTVGGPYTITYTTPGTCSTSSTFQISITAAVRIIANNFALDFNGTDEYINVNSNGLGLTTAISISAWVKIPSGAGNSFDFYTTIAEDNLGGTNRNWFFGWRSGYKDFYFQVYHSNSTNTQLLSNVGDVNDGNWHHVVGVYDGTTSTNGFKLYVDNVVGETTATSTGVANNNIPTYIGATNINNIQRFFEGDIDEVAVWNKAISANTVQEIYNATTNNPGFTADLFKLANESQAPVYWNRMGDD